jgi:hypothetical protein
MDISVIRKRVAQKPGDVMMKKAAADRTAQVVGGYIVR